MLGVLRGWSRRRWLAAAASALLTGLVIALPTAMVANPVFGRDVPTTWWAWPVLLVVAVLSGLLVGTYVREPTAGLAEEATLDKRGAAGGLLAFFAVGCPVCNKLVLLALGYTGALRWFAPVQPVLAVAGVALLGWALRSRLRGEVACAAPARERAPTPR